VRSARRARRARPAGSPQGEAGPQGEQGPQGEAAPQGDTGEAGPQGIPGVSGYEIVQRTVSLPRVNGNVAFVTSLNVACSDGKSVLGGGQAPDVSDLVSAVTLVGTPDLGGTRSWNVTVYRNPGVPGPSSKAGR
jgi:hypothetical protein